MTIATRHMKEDVTHWAIAGSDGYGGFTFGTPVKLKGRWEEKAVLFLTPSGEEVVSSSIVYLPSAIAVGDYLGLGDLTATADPTTITDTWRVRQHGRNTDLRNLQSVRKVFL